MSERNTVWPRLRLRSNPLLGAWFVDANDREVATIPALLDGWEGERLARLWVGAPALVEAAREAEDWLRQLSDDPQHERTQGILSRLRAALAPLASPEATPRPPCKVEGCGRPIAPEGSGQDCPYTCEEHAPGWGSSGGSAAGTGPVTGGHPAALFAAASTAGGTTIPPRRRRG